jgi:hypothetical protein
VLSESINRVRLCCEKSEVWRGEPRLNSNWQEPVCATTRIGGRVIVSLHAKSEEGNDCDNCPAASAASQLLAAPLRLAGYSYTKPTRLHQRGFTTAKSLGRLGNCYNQTRWRKPSPDVRPWLSDPSYGSSMTDLVFAELNDHSLLAKRCKASDTLLLASVGPHGIAWMGSMCVHIPHKPCER